MQDERLLEFRQLLRTAISELQTTIIMQVDKVSFNDNDELETRRKELFKKTYGDENYKAKNHSEWKTMWELLGKHNLQRPQRKFSAPIDYSPEYAKEIWSIVRRVIYSAEPVYEESYYNYRHFGIEVSDRYNGQILKVLRHGIDFINDLILHNDPEFSWYLEKDRITKATFNVHPADTGEIVLLTSQVIELNKLFYFLSNRLYFYYPDNIFNDEEFSHGLPNIGNRLALISELGIIDFLLSKYDKQLSNQPKRIANLLSLVMGIDKEDGTNFYATVKHLLNNTPAKTPRNPKALKIVKTELTKLGLI